MYELYQKPGKKCGWERTSHVSSTSHSLFRNDFLVYPVHCRVGVAAMAEVDWTKTAVGVTRVNSLDMDNYLKLS